MFNYEPHAINEFSMSSYCKVFQPMNVNSFLNLIDNLYYSSRCDAIDIDPLKSSSFKSSKIHKICDMRKHF